LTLKHLLTEEHVVEKLERFGHGLLHTDELGAMAESNVQTQREEHLLVHQVVYI